jgi:hypothetical protein
MAAIPIRRRRVDPVTAFDSGATGHFAIHDAIVGMTAVKPAPGR